MRMVLLVANLQEKVMSEKIIKYAAPVLAFLFIILFSGCGPNTKSQELPYNSTPKENINVAVDNTSPNITSSNPIPIDRANERVTKKPFGIFVTPQNSPVSPERFSGYHTGTDFETFTEEQDSDVPVYAIRDGKVIYKRWVSGYGGVIIQSAMINNQSVTILYGHLNLASIDKKIGDNLAEGEKIGVLGKGYSTETDGERKHLHLGIHRGSSVNLRGYVSSKNQLSDWIDSMNIISNSPNF